MLCMAFSYILELFTLWVIDYLWRYSWCFSWTCHVKTSVGQRERTTGSSWEWTFRFVFTFFKVFSAIKNHYSWLFSIDLHCRISNGDRLPECKRNDNNTYCVMISTAQMGWTKLGETIGSTQKLVGILTLLLLGIRWHCWQLSKVMEEAWSKCQKSDLLMFYLILEVIEHCWPQKDHLPPPALRIWSASLRAPGQSGHCAFWVRSWFQQTGPSNWFSFLVWFVFCF